MAGGSGGKRAATAAVKAEAAEQKQRADRTVWVGRLPENDPAASVRKIMGQFGGIESVNACAKPGEGRSWALVRFTSDEMAMHAVEAVQTGSRKGYGNVRVTLVHPEKLPSLEAHFATNTVPADDGNQDEDGRGERRGRLPTRTRSSVFDQEQDDDLFELDRFGVRQDHVLGARKIAGMLRSDVTPSPRAGRQRQSTRTVAPGMPKAMHASPFADSMRSSKAAVGGGAGRRRPWTGSTAPQRKGGGLPAKMPSLARRSAPSIPVPPPDLSGGQIPVPPRRLMMHERAFSARGVGGAQRTQSSGGGGGGGGSLRWVPRSATARVRATTTTTAAAPAPAPPPRQGGGFEPRSGPLSPRASWHGPVSALTVVRAPGLSSSAAPSWM
jgi:hypothetical protein